MELAETKWWRTFSSVLPQAADCGTILTTVRAAKGSRNISFAIIICAINVPKQLNYCSIPGIFSSGLPEKQAVILFWQQQGQRGKESIWWRSLDCHSIVCQTPGHWLLFMMCWKPQIVEVSVSYALQLIGVICRSQWTYSWTLRSHVGAFSSHFICSDKL